MSDIPKSTTLQHRLESLNGWQRSWCIVVLVWLLGCTAITVYDFPPEPTEDVIWQEAYQREQFEAALTTDKTVQFSTESYVDLVKEAAQEKLLPVRVSVIEKGLALWVFPSVGLYLLGMGISWTRRGFRKPS
jgi:hypothetical protein